MRKKSDPKNAPGEIEGPPGPLMQGNEILEIRSLTTRYPSPSNGLLGRSPKIFEGGNPLKNLQARLAVGLA